MPPAQQAQPAANRTQLLHVVGAAATLLEETWSVDATSPLVTSLCFIDWTTAANARTTAPRSVVGAAIILATRRSTDLERATMRAMPFLTHELKVGDASNYLHELDKVQAFDQVYTTPDEWIQALPPLFSKMQDPNVMRLRADVFYSTEAVGRSPGPPRSLAFLTHVSLEDLCSAGGPDEHLPLSRALILSSSKDTRAERANESSTIRLVMERVHSMLVRSLGSTLSDAGLARGFCTMMATLYLPHALTEFRFEPMHALTELEAAFAYSRGNAAETSAIEEARILRVPRQFENLRTLLGCFGRSSDAWIQVGRLAATLLSPAMAGAATLVKLSALDELMGRASWQAMITHALNANHQITGIELVTTMLLSQTDLAGPVSGGSFSTTTPSGQGDVGALGVSYGSVREASLAEALRSDEARDALQEAETLVGIDRVEAFMQSGSTICMRAMLYQEAWLVNKVPQFGFCSLDVPYVCPYFSQYICEDKDTGEVPSRAKGYVFKDTYLAALRTPKWSAIPILEIALEIQSLLTAASYVPVAKAERYTVDSCLCLIRDLGERLFFALGLSLAPQQGKSFVEGVDFHRKAVTFARTLPAAEQAEWLPWLVAQFETNFLDAGGALYQSKMRSSMPGHVSAAHTEFVGDDCIYFSNVTARMKRAEPIADMRIAFPSLLSSAPISLPGTSTQPVRPAKPPKQKQTGKKGPGDGGPPAPGSRSSASFDVSPTEFFHCGVVFKSNEIIDKYKLNKKCCLAVLLSKKKGADALQSCPDPSTHGDINAAVHKRPANFDLDYIYKHHTRKATAAELKQANWSPRKKSKA